MAVLVPVVRDGLPEEMRLVGMLERSSRISSEDIWGSACQAEVGSRVSETGAERGSEGKGVRELRMW